MADNDRQNKLQEQHSKANQQANTPRSVGLRSNRRDANRNQMARTSSWSGASPFDLLRRLNDEMDRWFGGGFAGWPGFGHLALENAWTPSVEVFQRGDELVVRADLPGLDKDDVDVEISDDAVTIRGERKQEHAEEREGYYRSERSYGSFYRMIPLPEGAIADSAKADFNNGVLEITVQVPPAEVRRGRKVQIGERQSNQAQNAQRSQNAQSSAAGQKQTQ